MTLHPDSPQATAAHRETGFDSHGSRCAAWHFPARSDALDGPAGRPAVVMAHGFGGTVDSGLEPFAAALAAAGLDVLAFDFRGFGASEGEPRQHISLTGQADDYRAALRAAAALPGVNPRALVLWGVSMSGGHVFTVGADGDREARVAAIVALTPLVDGPAAAWHALRGGNASAALRAAVVGARGCRSALPGHEPVHMPLVGRPGEVAALALPGQYDAYHSLAGPTWRNQVDADIAVTLPRYRPAKRAKHIRCPLLVQIADFDRSAPPQSAARAAFAGRAEVRHYPCDHFDVWPGNAWFDAVVAHQTAFLTRHLAAADGLPSKS